MSEERRKSRHREEILRAADRCVYCPNPPEEVEHMPPRGLFTGKHRPSGMEYAACKQCNQGTRGSDLTAIFLAKLRPFKGDLADPLYLEATKQAKSLDRLAPGLKEELFDDTKARSRWVQSPKGVYEQVVEIRADGPVLAGHLTAFGAKLAMATYREHVKTPLPLDGAVFVQPYLNAGLSQKSADAMLRILPGFNTLRQGSFEVPDQFAYRYNCDDKSILAALVSLHSNLHFNFIATSDPSTYRPVVGGMFSAEIAPGKLLDALATKSIVPPKLMK